MAESDICPLWESIAACGESFATVGVQWNGEEAKHASTE